MRASNERVEMLLMIIIGTGREVRFCVQKIGDVSVLYYREKETGDSMEFSNKTLMARINKLWKGTKIVHGKPRPRLVYPPVVVQSW